jgi:Major Facilitator Superfamily.
MNHRHSAAPLLIGTFLQRANSGAVTIVLGLLLAQSARSAGHMVTSIQIGLLPVVFFVTELTLSPLFGSLSDRWGRKQFLVIGPLFGFVQACLLLLMPHENPLPYILCLQAVAGVSSAMSVPAVLGYLADFTMQRADQRIRLMSLYELVTSGGLGTGTVLGGIVWDRMSHWSFALIAAIYLAVSSCMLLAPTVQQHVSTAKANVTFQRYWSIVRMPRLFIFIPAWLCISALLGIWLSSQVSFILSNPVHLPQQLLMGSMSSPGGGRHLSAVLGGVVLFFGLCLLFWAFFLHRVARLRLMCISVLGVFLACIALWGLNHHGIHNTIILLIWLPILMIGVFAASGFAPSALAYLADISEDAAQDRGMVMGLYSIFLAVGQIVGNGLGGVFAHRFGFDGLIYLTVLLACVALLALGWLFVQDKRLGHRQDVLAA